MLKYRMIILKGVTITVTDNALTPMTGTSIRTDNNHDIEKIAKIEEILTRKNTIDQKFDKTMNGAIELHLQTDSITEIGYHPITPQIEIMAITNQESTELKIERTMITVITGIDTIAMTDIMTEKMIIDDRILHLIPIDHQIGTDMTVLTNRGVRHSGRSVSNSRQPFSQEEVKHVKLAVRSAVEMLRPPC